ncbi:5-hydroxytryptamine receptor 6-like [Lytechinus variegatus]|uniref:5-hydroxytryptamine receptor 6-like n=1 Tax=Lytechinus variegatus TaxID=7654 RepID=UPI001BB10E45|nr:5-hydroxytryptamine receptor 6-like [Lytechinus variegatus]
MASSNSSSEYLETYSTLFYLNVAQLPLSVLANAFTYCILRYSTSGFDSVTKMLLIALTVCYAAYGVGQAITSLLQLVPMSAEAGFTICIYQGVLTFPWFFVTLTVTCLLNLNRYIMVAKPLRYHHIVTDRRAVVVMSVSITSSILLSIVGLPIPKTPSGYFMLNFCSSNMDELKANFVLIFCVSFLLIAVFTTVVSTVSLLVIARKQSKAIADGEIAVTAAGSTVKQRKDRNDTSADAGEEMATTRRQRKSNRRALLTIFLLNVVIFVSWLPLAIFFVLIGVGANLPPVFASVHMFLSMSTSWWHCLVYLITNKMFRETAKDVFKKTLGIYCLTTTK